MKQKLSVFFEMIMMVADAIGSNAFLIIGVEHGISNKSLPLICIICGVATALGGGIISSIIKFNLVRVARDNYTYYICIVFTSSIYLYFRLLGFQSEYLLMSLLIPSTLCLLLVNKDFRNKCSLKLVDSDVIIILLPNNVFYTKTPYTQILHKNSINNAYYFSAKLLKSNNIVIRNVLRNRLNINM